MGEVGKLQGRRTRFQTWQAKKVIWPQHTLKPLGLLKIFGFHATTSPLPKIKPTKNGGSFALAPLPMRTVHVYGWKRICWGFWSFDVICIAVGDLIIEMMVGILLTVLISLDCRGRFHVQWFKVRNDCLFCWYRWNCWPPLSIILFIIKRWSQADWKLHCISRMNVHKINRFHHGLNCGLLFYAMSSSSSIFILVESRLKTYIHLYYHMQVYDSR